MIQRDERARGASPPAGLAEHLRHLSLILRSELAVGSPLLARFGLIAIALVLQALALSSPGHFRPAGNGILAFLVALETLLSVVAAFAATLPLKRLFSMRVRQVLGMCALFTVATFPVFGLWQVGNGVRATARNIAYNNDGAVMDLYAAQQVVRGHNPYEAANIADALAAVNAPSTTTTPLMDGQFRGTTAYPSEGAVNQVFLNVLNHRSRRGVPLPAEFESKYNYPAGSFLFILPFVWAGVHDLRFLYALAVVAMGTYLWFRMPRALRFFAPLLVLADIPLIQLTAGGQPDPLYGLFLMLALAEWSTPWLSPLAMGVAIATKQLSWFFLPLYLILIWREQGKREALRRCGLMAVVFLAMNGPFIARSPGAYLASIAGPMTDPMFPLGVGIIALFVSNVLPMLPKVVFSLLEAVAWIGGVIAFVRLRWLSAGSIAVLGTIPLFFAWRSLVNYFYLAPVLALAIYLAARQNAESQRVLT